MDKFCEIRTKVYNRLCFVPDGQSEVLSQKLYGIDIEAKKCWMTLNKITYLWDELDDTQESRNITSSYRRVYNMILAYKTFGTELYNNKELCHDILCALENLHKKYYNSGQERYDNWWDWMIGVPKLLLDSCILMWNEIDEGLLKGYLEALRHFVPEIIEGDILATGANRAWVSIVLIKYASLAYDENALKRGRDALDDIFSYVESGDGFYRDGSFIQHDKMPYNGGYAYALFIVCIELLDLLYDTEYSLNKEHQTILLEWLEKALLPFVFEGKVMQMVRGREIARSYPAAIPGAKILIAAMELTDIIKFVDFSSLRLTIATNMNSIINELYQTATVSNLFAINRLLDETKDKDYVNSNYYRQYGAIDKAVYRYNDFTMALSMSSNRTYKFECMNGENLRGWFMSDGMTYYYTKGNDYFDDIFWPTADPYKLPGTTVSEKKRINGDNPDYLTPLTMAGGVSNGEAGVSAMLLDAYNSTLSAKKSWFCIDGKVVALGSGITAHDLACVRTTIDNRIVSNKLNVVSDNVEIIKSTELSDAKYVSIRDDKICMSFYFPNGGNVSVIDEIRTGKWSDISKIETDELYEKRYLTLSFDHGTDPNDANYEYIVLPGYSKEEVEKFVKSPDIVVLENSQSIHSVYSKSNNTIGIVFFNEYNFDMFYCYSPATVLWQETENGFILSLSDPTQQQDEIVLEINGKYEKADVVSGRINLLYENNKTRILFNVKDMLGSSITLNLKRRE